MGVFEAVGAGMDVPRERDDFCDTGINKYIYLTPIRQKGF